MRKKIYFEYPIDWFKESKVEQITFIQNIIRACFELEFELVCIPAPYPSYGITRLSSKHSLISFHSYENPENVLSYKEAPIKGLFSLDKKGYAGWSDICLNFSTYIHQIEKISSNEIKETLDYYREQLLNRNSKHPQHIENKKLPEKYLLFPLQVRTDSVAAHANLDMADVLKKVSFFAKKYKKNVVVKVHPYCNSEVIKAIQFIEAEENPYFHTSNTHIIQLIQEADKVLSCNSGASLEALILGKDVSCFGKSEWYEITNKIEVDEELEQIFIQPSNHRLSFFQEQYLTFLLKYYWLKDDDLRKIKQILFNLQPREDIHSEEFADIYSEFTNNLLTEQTYLTNAKNRIALIEKDFQYMQQILNYFRRRPWKVFKLFIQQRIMKLKKRK